MFDDRQMQCLHALLDTVIPADEYPGAWDAGLGEFLLRQLGGDLAGSLPSYQTWLRELEGEAQVVYGQSFASLDLAERTRLLTKIERNEVAADWSSEPADFFREIVEHCAEGFYSDPGNGGNSDGLAWQMIGFEVRA